MNVATQIGGHIYPDSTALLALKNMFTQLGISVTHPTPDESLFYTDSVNAAWQQYNSELFFYESIADSAFHVIYNDEKIDKDMARQILYAMLKNQPIVMTGKPVFARDVSSFARELITRHADTFHFVDLPELELTELSKLFSKVKPVDYNLLGSEKILINARIKAHFRELLDLAKN
jgi:hypothetical protein